MSRRAGSTRIVQSVPMVPHSLMPKSEPLPSAADSVDSLEQSDVFIYAQPKPNASLEVTLFVHGWHNVEPGLLSWTFPSLRAALDAVQRMKNAVAWCIVSGAGWQSLEEARASGGVLVEQLT